MTEALVETPLTGKRKVMIALGWVLIAAGILAAFGENGLWLWDRWFPAWNAEGVTFTERFTEGDSYYSHGPLVPLVSLCIMALLIRHTRMAVRPRMWTGLAVIFASLTLHMLAYLTWIQFCNTLALIGVLMGLVLTLWGWEAFRRFFFPVAFLVFMVPMPQVVVGELSFKLKLVAADWGTTVANLLGVVAERSGAKVLLLGDSLSVDATDAKELVVDDVCSGLRSLISLLAFGALYAYVCRVRKGWRAFLFLMSVPVAIASNCLRIASIIIVAHIWNVEFAAGTYHDSSGILVFIIAFMMMFGLEKLILAGYRLAGKPYKILPLADGVRLERGETTAWKPLVAAGGAKVAVVIIALLTAGAVGGAMLDRAMPESPDWTGDVASKSLPTTLDVAGETYHGRELGLEDYVTLMLGTDDYLNRIYLSETGGDRVDVLVVYAENKPDSFHRPEVCLKASGNRILSQRNTVLDGVEGHAGLPCRELIIDSGPGTPRRLFMYTLKSGDEYTESYSGHRFSFFFRPRVHGVASGALIRVLAAIHGDDVAGAKKLATDFLRAAVPHFDRNLDSKPIEP